MKTQLSPLIIGLLMFNVSFAQTPETYPELISEAFKLYASKDYKKSAATYTRAFDQLDGKASSRDRYNAACACALAGDVERSFDHLFSLAEDAETKYKNYGHITKDTDLELLHSDERWEKLIAMVKTNKEEAEKNLDQALVDTLAAVRQQHINNRHLIPQIETHEAEHGKTEEMTSHRVRIEASDSKNLMAVKNILDERGWLGEDIVGERGNYTLFLIIQHADLETQVKYLPLMQKAVKQGNAKASTLAYLEDKMAIAKDNRQIYGSHIGKDEATGEQYVLPLMDPQNVDQRRSEIGLGTLADYVNAKGMVWDVEKHIARTKKLEAEKGK